MGCGPVLYSLLNKNMILHLGQYQCGRCNKLDCWNGHLITQALYWDLQLAHVGEWQRNLPLIDKLSNSQISAECRGIFPFQTDLMRLYVSEICGKTYSNNVNNYYHLNWEANQPQKHHYPQYSEPLSHSSYPELAVIQLAFLTGSLHGFTAQQLPFKINNRSWNFLRRFQDWICEFTCEVILHLSWTFCNSKRLSVKMKLRNEVRCFFIFITWYYHQPITYRTKEKQYYMLICSLVTHFRGSLVHAKLTVQ